MYSVLVITPSGEVETEEVTYYQTKLAAADELSRRSFVVHREFKHTGAPLPPLLQDVMTFLSESVLHQIMLSVDIFPVSTTLVSKYIFFGETTEVDNLIDTKEKVVKEITIYEEDLVEHAISVCKGYELNFKNVMFIESGKYLIEKELLSEEAPDDNVVERTHEGKSHGITKLTDTGLLHMLIDQIGNTLQLSKVDDQYGFTFIPSPFLERFAVRSSKAKTVNSLLTVLQNKIQHYSSQLKRLQNDRKSLCSS